MNNMNLSKQDAYDGKVLTKNRATRQYTYPFSNELKCSQLGRDKEDVGDAGDVIHLDQFEYCDAI